MTDDTEAAAAAARHVLTHARARDRAEIEATSGFAPACDALVASLPSAVLARIFAHEQRPTALVLFHALTPRALAVSMIATDDWPRVARAVVKWGVREAKPFLLSHGFRRAECRAIDGHQDAIDLLLHLGFRLECRIPDFGRNGEPFLQLAWRLSDH